MSKSKVGDVYTIRIEQGSYYLQLVAIDTVNLGSDAVIVSRTNPLESKPEILFYTHTMVDAGEKQGLWSKIGNAEPEVDLPKLVFKTYRGDDIAEAEKLIDNTPTVAFPNWFTWNLLSNQMEIIPDRVGQQLQAESGSIFPPGDILYRLVHGKSEFNAKY